MDFEILLFYAIDCNSIIYFYFLYLCIKREYKYYIIILLIFKTKINGKKRKEKSAIKNYCRQRRVATRDPIISSDSFFHLTDFVSICYRQCPTARIEPSPLNKAAETLVTHELSCYCRTLPNLVFFCCMCISVEKNRAKSTKLSLIGSILVKLRINKDKNEK